MRAAVGWAALACAALWLAACTSMPVPVAAVPRSALATFELEGRVSVVDGERSGGASIYWLHTPARDQIDFISPMGQIVARLSGSSEGALLEMPGGERRQAASVEELAAQSLGLRLPVERLRSWVQAAPGPRARVLRLDAIGRPGLISEDGWLVDYLSYADDDPSASVRHMQAVLGELEVRLLVDQWQAR